MPRVLVTAALGNVGREVVRECRDRGLSVRVADRHTPILNEHFSGVEQARFDYGEPSTWASALTGCNQVFLLRPPAVGNMASTLCPFIDAAYSLGVEHVVFLSVAGAERMRWVPHHKVEAHLLRSGKRWTILRPGFFAQNMESAYRQDIVEDDRIFLPAGEGRVAFVDVRDIGAVAASVFQNPSAFAGQALALTGPEAITFTQVAELLTRAVSRPIRYEPATIQGYVWHLRTKRKLTWMQTIIQTILHVGLRHGDAEEVVSTVAQVLGRPPGTMAAYVERSAATWRTSQR